MMYTICHYEDVRRKQLMAGATDDSLGQLAILKLGVKNQYPGGEVFETIGAAEDALVALNVFEVKDRASNSSTQADEFRIFGIDPPRHYLYWHRGSIRLKHDTKLLEVYNLAAVRHSFSTEVMFADNYAEILDTLAELFPSEDMVQHNLCEWRFMFSTAIRDSGFAGYRLIVSGPATKEFALAKLRLAA